MRSRVYVRLGYTRSAMAGVRLGAYRTQPDGPEVATAEAQEPTEQSAWNAALELYRQHVIV